MAVVFGTSSKGKATVIYRNFEYIKERDNLCGTTSWHCQKYQSMQCKARLITSGNRPQTTRTCSDLRSFSIPHRNLESARCRVRRHSSQHQQRWGVAPRAAVTVPVSPPNRVDLHEWHSTGHPAPEITISAGYDWSKSLVCKKILCTERSCCASSSSLWSRWSTGVSSFDCVLVAHIDKWYCNSKYRYSDLYEHYVNSVKLVVNNRLSIIDNMLSYVV